MSSLRFRFVLTLLLGVLAAGPLAHADWPQFLGPNRDATSPETGLLRTWPNEGPKVVWTTAVGEGFGAPSIVDNVVYVLDRKEEKTDVLRAISLANGSDLWSYSYDAPGSVSHTGSRTPPTVDDQHIYTVGMMGHLTCVDRATHKPLWQKNLMEEFKMELPQWGFSQSPVLYKNLVIIAVQAPDTFAVAFDRATGAVVWKSPPMGLAGYVSPLVTTLAGVEQVVVLSASSRDGSSQGATAGLSLADGSVLWKYEGWQCFIPIPNPTPMPGDKLFITGGYGSGSAIIQIKKNGEALEAVEVAKIDDKECGSQIQQPIVYQDHLYVNSNSNERINGMSCLDLNGKVLWRTKDNDEYPDFERGSFILADGLFIALDGKNGKLHLVEPSPAGFKQLAHAQVLEGSKMWAPLALSGGKLVVRSQDTMKCLDLKNP